MMPPKARGNPMQDLPDECEYGSCDEEPEFKVVFSNPLDNVYYCEEHAFEVMDLPDFSRMVML